MIDLNNFNREQRKVVEDVITGGVPPQYVHIIARPKFTADEMNRIVRLVNYGQAKDLPVGQYVKMGYSVEKMELMARWIEETYNLNLAETCADEAIKSGKHDYHSCCTYRYLVEGVDSDLIHYTVGQYLKGKLTRDQMIRSCEVCRIFEKLDFEQRAAMLTADSDAVSPWVFEKIANPKLKPQQMKGLLKLAAGMDKDTHEPFVAVTFQMEKMIAQNEAPQKISIRDKLDGYSSDKPRKQIRYIKDNAEKAKIPKTVTYAPKHKNNDVLEL